ncbi:MAG: choice-of-anchor L domain-containing protein, partial [Bacteroidota bacterium]
RVPVPNQTRGTVLPAPAGLQKIGTDLDPTIIGNRNVMIYAPFEAAFAPDNEGPSVQAILQNSGYEFSITYLRNQQADIASLSSLTDYGFVLLATHGSQGNSFATGEVVDTTLAVYQTSYKAMLKAQKLAIWTNMVISNAGAVSSTADIYAVRHPFVADLAGNFPNSVILNNSCESTMNPDLGNAFINKGAKAYYGYTLVVNSDYCVTNADTIARRLAADLRNTGDAYIPGSDPNPPNAVIELKGRTDLHYPDSLINGDFELGTITGWTKEGDGRVISQLGSQSPTGGSYMGIISTGLGFTTSTGRIFQTFRIRPGQATLRLKWNFLSEEFLEYIGSQYQDYFEVVLRPQAGSEVVLMRKTIDMIASEFGATDSTAGNLISVSPGIVFDRGGVYMTGWQTNSFGIANFAGQRVTLILRAGDVGDSVFDTAILLDDITVN